MWCAAQRRQRGTRERVGGRQRGQASQAAARPRLCTKDRAPAQRMGASVRLRARAHSSLRRRGLHGAPLDRRRTHARTWPRVA